MKKIAPTPIDGTVDILKSEQHKVKDKNNLLSFEFKILFNLSNPSVSNSIPSKFKSLNAHLSDFKKYLKTHQCSEWMLSEEFGIDISNTRIILGILILRGEVWKTVEQRCLTANKEAFFWTSNREIGEYFDQGRRLNHE